MADWETRLAFAYGTLENDKNLLQKLAEIIEREKCIRSNHWSRQSGE